MKKQAFTLMEIVIVIVVIGILATIGIPGYQNTIEDAKARVCEMNLETLQLALDDYAMEYDKIPASLSELPQEYIQKAYVKILQRKDAWKIKLAYFILERQTKNFAYAQSFISQLSGGNMASITCPADTTPPGQGGISYGFNSILGNMTKKQYQALPVDTALIGDCESATYTSSADLDERHKHSFENYAQKIDKDGEGFKCRGATCKGNGRGKRLKYQLQP